MGDAQVMSKWGQQSVDANPDMMKALRRVKNLEPQWRFCFPTAVEFNPKTDEIIVADSQRNRLQVYARFATTSTSRRICNGIRVPDHIRHPRSGSRISGVAASLGGEGPVVMGPVRQSFRSEDARLITSGFPKHPATLRDGARPCSCPMQPRTTAQAAKDRGP